MILQDFMWMGFSRVLIAVGARAIRAAGLLALLPAWKCLILLAADFRCQWFPVVPRMSR
jgi:hypothetical protein